MARLENNHRIGIDLVPVKRVEKSLERFGQKMLERFLGKSEIDEILSLGKKILPQRLAGRIAAKEAVMKVLGEGWPYIPWEDIEILRPQGKRPLVYLGKKAEKMRKDQGIGAIEISITHDAGLAIAVAFGEVLR